MKLKTTFLLSVYLSLIFSCKQVSFTSVKQIVIPTEPPTPTPTPPLQLTLSVVKLNPESWNKICLYASLNGNEEQNKLVGCNKGESPIGRPVILEVDQKICNSLRFSFAVYKFKKNCGPDSCNNDPTAYDTKPDYIRSTKTPADLSYFKVYDARYLSLLDPLIVLNKDQSLGNAQTVAAAIEFLRPPKSNRWVRAYFEDQSNENLKEFVDNGKKSGKKDLGVDFNDFIFDVKIENLKVAIEGTPISCVN